MKELRIISYNVNGIRSAINKGLIDWLRTDPGDIVCFQETKASRDNIDHSVFATMDYEDYWFSAQKKGYSGVAFLTHLKPDEIVYGNKMQQSDFEGRIIRMNIGDLTIINAYFPSGTSGDERQEYKYKWLDEFMDYVQELRKTHPRLIICGDYNIAHEAIDIHDPKGNKNSSGFLPEERAWMDRFLEKGFIDSFRYFHKEPHQYSWWSQRFPHVRAQNKGWRIDYICVTENLQHRLKAASILPDVKQSDHCPVTLTIEL